MPATAATTALFSAQTAVRPHPVYATMRPIWAKLAEVVEGSGGFLTGAHLIAHPREWVDHTNPNPVVPSKKLLERRALARYENWADTILSLLAGALFRHPPSRRVGDGTIPHPIDAFWADIDGIGTPAAVWWESVWKSAAAFGHIALVLDRPSGVVPTAADAAGFYVRAYGPLDVPDWLQDDRGALTGITVLEALPRTTFDAPPVQATQARRITAEGWAVTQRIGPGTVATVSAGDWDYAGALPVVLLYGKMRALTPIIGQSILGDPMLFVDDYNLTSEVRELLRKQTFSILNIPLGTGPDAVSKESAIAMAGETAGTANVLFSPVEAKFIAADPSNVEAYQTERQEVRRAMFRLAGLPWEGDSRAPETAEARRLKREDLNQVLATYAAHLQAADRGLAQLWFKGTYGDGWRQEWDKADVTIEWPDAFDSESLDGLITRAQQAIALELGKTAEVEMKRQVVRGLLRGAPKATLETINNELAALPTAEERQAQAQADRMARLGAQAVPADPEAHA